TGDFQPLIDVEGVGPVDIAERLIGEHALGGQERPALAEEVVESVACDPHPRQPLRLSLENRTDVRVLLPGPPPRYPLISGVPSPDCCRSRWDVGRPRLSPQRFMPASHACGFALVKRGHDTRALQAYLGH